MKSFYQSVEQILFNDSTLEIQLRLLRDLLVDCLQSEDFRLNCINELLGTIENWNGEFKTWNAPAFFYHERLRFSVRMIFWPGFYENNPHEHKTWSVTGVFFNTLNISTYDLMSTQKSLKKNRTFSAKAGEVGYLIPGCIHSIKNSTSELSSSIHIFNNIDIAHPEENAIWYPAPRKENLMDGLLERALSACLCSLSEIKQNNSLELVKRVYDLGSITTKYLAIKSMYSFDPNISKEYFERLM